MWGWEDREEQWEGITMYERTVGDDRYVYYPDFCDGFMGMYI